MNTAFKKILLLCSLIFILIAACSGCRSGDTATPLTSEEEPIKIDNKTDKSTPQIEEHPSLLCSHSGLPVAEMLIRPFAVVIDNHRSAQPQSGLQQAPLVYEVPVEGGITRLLAIFPHTVTGDLGPVRSARPYFAHLARENDAILVHCGSSAHTKALLRKNEYANIDEFPHPRFFYRSDDRRPPHNLFTSIPKLLEGAKALGSYQKTNQPGPFKFANHTDQGGVTKVEIPFSNHNHVSYRWHEKEGAYLRSINNRPHFDANNNQQILVKNIIIQYVPFKFISDVSRYYNLVGSGDALIISNGHAEKLRWEKKDYGERTRFYLENGSPLILSPGNTWIHIISPDRQAIITRSE